MYEMKQELPMALVFMARTQIRMNFSHKVVFTVWTMGV